MGKYNFSTLKIQEIMERLEALEKRNCELIMENLSLKEQISPPKAPVRSLRKDLQCFDKIENLMKYTAVNGEIVETADETTIYNNFTVLYTNILRVLAPRCYTEPSNVPAQKDKSRLRGCKIAELSDEEYKIFLETTEAIVDTLYYAKNKLMGVNNADT